jgi:predicted phage baseplate assembly protein
MSGERCGCCEGIHVETPRTIDNRPGLTAIAYRAGDFLSFKHSMLAALNRGVLSRLTRDDDDFSIALLDAWATTADILTFYQERIANESYLRTAKERLSVLELARLLGYELGPGVAAAAALAFTVDGSTGAPGRLTIEAGTRVQSVPGQNELPQTFETSQPLDARAQWNELHPRKTADGNPKNHDTDVYLDGTATNLRPGDGLLFVSGSGHAFRRVSAVIPDFDAKRTRVTWALALSEFPPLLSPGGLGGALTAVAVSPTLSFARIGVVTLASVAIPIAPPVTVSAMRVQTPLFGANAVDPKTLSHKVRLEFGDPAMKEWTFTIAADAVDLDGPRPEIHAGSQLVLMLGGGDHRLFAVTEATQITRAAYALVGKATRLKVDSDPSAFITSAEYRATVAFAADEPLTVAERPPASTTLDRSTIALDVHIDAFEAGRAIIVSGPGGGELATVGAVLQNDPLHTVLELKQPLTGTYDVRTAKIFANVAAATNGESVKETLGAGDAAKAFQRFRLSSAPLTYVHSGGTPRGAASTLEIRVNDVLWREVETLYGAGPHARVYITRRDDDGRTFVQFGDGATAGARLPTGTDNVRAAYRKGIGTGANVDAGKLTMLLSRPLGLSDVNNPLPAEGGAGAEVLADARLHAPRNVRTLDRVVSLVDYQAFAESFEGIAKAYATWTMTDTRRQLFLTVAGPDGALFTAKSPTVLALAGALKRFGDPYVPLRIASYVRAPFQLKAKIGIAADRLAAEVLGRVRAAVADAFSFDARAFGEAVDLSDVIAVMQNVDGVVSVDIDLLYRSRQGAARNERLSSRLPRQFPDGGVSAAEILVLEHADITESR